MARLHEYQGKAILAANGFKIPRGRAVLSADDAVVAAKELGGEVVIKIQAWTTGRAGIGGVAFAKGPDDVRAHAERMLSMKVGQFPVEAVLFEEKIDIDREFFLSFAIDDAARAPVIIFAAGGGTGIEKRAASIRRIACDVSSGPEASALNEAVDVCGLSQAHAEQLAESMRKLFAAARSVEARSLEINPLVLTKSGEFVAADCRITIDDYAVARHPELGIEIAREFDHPPTPLERIAYAVEQNDHRGTFYFAQLATTTPKGSKGLVGFHGAGGGGSMMSMDAIVNAGFTIANFTDTSGNPSASKVDGAPRVPKFVRDSSAMMLPVKNGRVWIDTKQWPQIRPAVETHSGGLIVDRNRAPVASLPSEDFATKDSELLACHVECQLAGIEGFYLELDIPALDDLIGREG